MKVSQTNKNLSPMIGNPLKKNQEKVKKGMMG
jgi:hypothetical protein